MKVGSQNRVVQYDVSQNRAVHKFFINRVCLSNDIVLLSATMLFFKLDTTNRYDIGLSNELLFVIIGQGAAKL